MNKLLKFKEVKEGFKYDKMDLPIKVLSDEEFYNFMMELPSKSEEYSKNEFEIIKIYILKMIELLNIEKYEIVLQHKPIYIQKEERWILCKKCLILAMCDKTFSSIYLYKIIDEYYIITIDYIKKGKNLEFHYILDSTHGLKYMIKELEKLIN